MFRVLWLAIKDVADELFVLVAVNFLYVLINLPLLGSGLLLLASGAFVPSMLVLLLSVLTFGPTTVGLYTVAQYVTEGRAVKVRAFFEAMRAQGKLGWQVYGAWMLGLLLIVINLRFYGQISSTIGLILVVVFVDLLVIWFGLLIYIGPLMVLQQDKRLRLIARNAFLMTLGRPLFTLVTIILMGVIVVLSFLITLPPFIITFALLAVWGFRATLKLIKDAEDRLAGKEPGAATPAEKGRGGQIRPK